MTLQEAGTSESIYPPSWRNWGGNQHATVQRFAAPASEAEIVAEVARTAHRAGSLRVAGAGHSFTAVVPTNDVLLTLDRYRGVVAVDPDRLRARVRAGTRLYEIGAPLWESGVALANQGDVDQQSLAGAIATGTKGSGINHGTMSSRVRAVRLIDGRGQVRDIDESTPDHLHAVQVAVGMLGVVTEVELDLVPAYLLQEANRILTYSALLEQWDDLLASYRHFSFWLMPQERSSRMYDLGDVPKGSAFVKLLREHDPDDDIPDGIRGDVGNRLGRGHLIYPDGTTEAQFHELEYMVPATIAREALAAVMRMMQRDWPDQISPIQVRWQQHDEAFLSAQYQRDTVSISVSGEIGVAYEPFLQAVAALLDHYDARPHWGKLHFLTRDRVEQLYPAYDRFQQIRHELDPHDVFLNAHLHTLFGT